MIRKLKDTKDVYSRCRDRIHALGFVSMGIIALFILVLRLIDYVLSLF